MKEFLLSQKLDIHVSKMGAYHILRIPNEIVETFTKKQKSRVRIILNQDMKISCALKPHSSGDFYVYFSKREVKKLKITAGDDISFSVLEHPHPLGVDVPEVLEIFLEQDEEAKAIYDSLTDGRKRTLVFMLIRMKDIDKQIDKIRQFLTEELMKKKGIKKL